MVSESQHVWMVLNPEADNVGIALRVLEAGEEMTGIKVVEPIRQYLPRPTHLQIRSDYRLLLRVRGCITIIWAWDD